MKLFFGNNINRFKFLPFLRIIPKCKHSVTPNKSRRNVYDCNDADHDADHDNDVHDDKKDVNYDNDKR